MTTLYVIRHAEAEGNLYRIAQGQANSIITDRGERQIRALSRRFADVPIDAVYASDLYRTCATAAAIYKPKRLPLHRRRDLREICVGVWEQKAWGQIAREDPIQLENFNHHLDLWHVEGAEPPRQVQERMLRAIQEISRENEGKTVAVFSHGYAIRLLLAELLGYTLEEFDRAPTGENTAVSLLQGYGERLELVFRDDASHLTNPAFAQGDCVRKYRGRPEPGLYFRPLELPEQTELLKLFSAKPEEANGALVGYLQETPVGLVAFDQERERESRCGWITWLAVRESWRGRGYGVQLLGQAVMHYRPLGRDRLRIELPADDETAERFCREYGFVSIAGKSGDRKTWEKNIGYQAEFLGE